MRTYLLVERPHQSEAQGNDSLEPCTHQYPSGHGLLPRVSLHAMPAAHAWNLSELAGQTCALDHEIQSSLLALAEHLTPPLKVPATQKKPGAQPLITAGVAHENLRKTPGVSTRSTGQVCARCNRELHVPRSQHGREWYSVDGTAHPAGQTLTLRERIGLLVAAGQCCPYEQDSQRPLPSLMPVGLHSNPARQTVPTTLLALVGYPRAPKSLSLSPMRNEVAAVNS